MNPPQVITEALPLTIFLVVLFKTSICFLRRRTSRVVIVIIYLTQSFCYVTSWYSPVIAN